MRPINSAEFRRAAVARIRDSGLSIRDIAREVGVSYEELRSWRQQEQTDLDEQFTGIERAGIRKLLFDAQRSDTDTKRTARKILALRLKLNFAREELRAVRRDLDASQPLSRDDR